MKFSIIQTLPKLGLLCFASFIVAQSQAQTPTVNTRSPGPNVTNADKTGQTGVGLQVGTLPGVAIDYWDSSRTTWNGSLVSEFGYGNVGIGAARLWKFPDAFGGDANQFVPYLGAGLLGVFGTQSDYLYTRTQQAAVAAQLPIGIDFLPQQERFGIFAELKPSLEVAPNLYGFFMADVGARFYF